MKIINPIKKILFVAALVTIALCASAKTIFSQTTENSTQPTAIQTEDERRKLLVSALERAQAEVVAGRKLIDALEAQIKSKQKLIDEMIRRDEKRIEVEKSLEAEIVSLKSAILSQATAMNIKSAEIEYLKKELKAAQKKLKSTQRREKWIVIGLGIFIAGKFIF